MSANIEQNEGNPVELPNDYVLSGDIKRHIILLVNNYFMELGREVIKEFQILN